jgi:hypothetical protein
MLARPLPLIPMLSVSSAASVVKSSSLASHQSRVSSLPRASRGQGSRNHHSLPNPFLVIRFRTLLRNEPLTNPSPSIACALFPIQRRGCLSPDFLSSLFHFPFAVHFSILRIPQVLCLPLLRKLPGWHPFLPILVHPERFLRRVHGELRCIRKKDSEENSQPPTQEAQCAATKTAERSSERKARLDRT